MANIAAIRSVGLSLIRYLNNAWEIAVFPSNVNKPVCTFALTTIGSLNDMDLSGNNVQVHITLYRTGDESSSA